MPTYVYRRQDGTTFEIDQRITEDALETCPTTGQPVSRIISGGAGLIFKGSGFYLTDYVRNGKDAKDTAKDADSNAKPTKDDGAKKDAPAKTTAASGDDT